MFCASIERLLLREHVELVARRAFLVVTVTGLMAGVMPTARVSMQTIRMCMLGMFATSRGLITFQTKLCLLRVAYLFLLETRCGLVIRSATATLVRLLNGLICMSRNNL